MTITKLAAVLTNLDNYTDFTVLGRLLSALVDVGTLITIFFLVRLWETKYRLDKRIKYWAAFFYAVAIFPIQQAHFFTVDPFLTFFLSISFYFFCRYYYLPALLPLFMSAIFFAAALATKISAVYFLPLFLFFLTVPLIKEKKITHFLSYLLLFTATSYFSLRIFDPHLFKTANFFSLVPSPSYVTNINQLKQLASPDAIYYPPAVQWLSVEPFYFALKNIFFFGAGPVLFLLAIGGLLVSFLRKETVIKILALYIVLFFIYQANQFSPSMRYFLPIYPYLAIYAALPLVEVERLARYQKVAVATVLLGVVIGTVSFMAIYTRPHSRVIASQWIYKNIAAGKTIATEHWDDALPLYINGYRSQQYAINALPVFAPDTGEKWQQINEILLKTDYIIFSSNRGYGSVAKVPQHYPKMSRFYENIFAGKSQFKKVKEFTSYPTFPLCFMLHASCFMINDQWSEEAFTVYDHPKVTIFEKK